MDENESLILIRANCNCVLNVKALVSTFNQEKALIGAFSEITSPCVDLRFKLSCCWWCGGAGAQVSKLGRYRPQNWKLETNLQIEKLSRRAAAGQARVRAAVKLNIIY